MLQDSIYVMLWKRQNCKDGKEISGCKKEVDGVNSKGPQVNFGGDVLTVVLVKGSYIFVNIKITIHTRKKNQWVLLYLGHIKSGKI